MFYLKNGKRKLYIEDDNVFTQCPRCGKEQQIDLADMVDEGQLDLYGVSVYCGKCSKKIRNNQQD